jgi:asparagine synthase (glutamine-hydrolysing)
MIKALQPFVKFSPDMAHLAWFLQSGRVYGAPFTFFEGVKELPGGHYLLVENGQVCAPVKWWDIDLDRVQATYQVNSPHNDFLRLMREAVGLQLRSDVPVGTCLSGGLDSSTIVALASEKLRAQPDAGRMNSFSSLYPVKGMDETQYVDIVEKAFNTISHRTSPSPDKFLERLRKITWHQDIPTAGPGVYSQHFVMELARGNVTVLLDGQGSDEMFAGYLLYVMLYLRSLRSHNPIAWLPQQIEFMLGVRARFNSALSLREFLARASKFLRRGSAPVSFISPDMSALAHQRRVELPSRELSGADALNSTLYKHIIYDSIPGLLHYEDRNSMAFGIEARVPFLDHRLVEFSMGVPGHHKIRGPETKVFMRHALKGILPDAIVNRKDKLGYPTPLAQWLRGPLREEITNYLNDVALKRAWYNTAHVRSLWARHLKGEISADWTIYQILTTELWYEQFIA